MHLTALAAALALPALATTTLIDHSPTADVRSPEVVSITTGDYYFEAPDTIPAGLTTFRLTNRGKEFHHIQLIRFDGGHSLPELLEAMQGGTMPSWAVMVGGPNAPMPNAQSEATLELEPGSYALICVIPSADGTPHVAKGMARPLHVVPADAPTEEPKADATMRLDDYSFGADSSVPAGRRTFRVENVAAQPHEMFIARLNPGKTAADFAAWAEKPEGPAPGVALGGATGLSQGQVNYLTLDLTPGEYALICFFPDAKDGKPHLAHGMMRQIRVE